MPPRPQHQSHGDRQRVEITHQLDPQQFADLLCCVREVFNTEYLRILQRVEHNLGVIMSQISDFADKVNAAYDKLNTAVEGVDSDVQALKAEILKLQATSGAVTPEDQALLDGIQARSEALAAKVEALDGLTSAPPTA